MILESQSNIPKTMIGVCTQQNTINVLPALQFKVKSFCFIETEFARKNHWIEGSKSVFQNNNIKLDPSIFLHHEENSRIDLIKKRILDMFYKHTSGIIFNFGGGQKGQSTGVWEAFKERNNPSDMACYTDQQTHTIELWSWENQQLVNSSFPINVNLPIDDLFQIYGVKVKKKGVLFYDKQNPVQQEETCTDLTQYAEFRKFVSACYKDQETLNAKEHNIETIKSWFTASGNLASQLIKKISKSADKFYNQQIRKYEFTDNEIISVLINGQLKYIREKFLYSILSEQDKERFEFSNESLIELLKDYPLKESQEISKKSLTGLVSYASKKDETWPQYYEFILASRIYSLLNKHTNIVVKAYSNVSVYENSESKKEIAEFDIVLVTSYGTIIILDAKTGDFDKKDEDARKHNLLKAAGIYATFIPVYLFYHEDVDKEYVVREALTKICEANHSGSLFLTYNQCNNPRQQFVFNGEQYNLNPINDLISKLRLNA